MAAIDGLLRLLTTQRADAITIESGKPPGLHQGGARVPLSMPPLARAVVDTMVAELLGGRAAADGPIQIDHAVAGRQFAITVKPGETGPILTARLAVVAAKPRAPAPARPAAVATEGAVPAGDEVDREVLQLIAELVLAHPGASDLFLSSDRTPRLREHGELREVDGPTFGDAALASLAREPALRRELDEHGSCDAALTVADRRLRVALFRHHAGVAVALRPVRDSAASLAALRLPAALGALTGHGDGLVLLCGATGSGKSTTLAALVEQVNRTSARHIVTLEDPIEYVYGPGRALIHQRQIGREVPSFATGLRAALRESPDLVLLGEARDRETIAAALTAAETGHLVMTSVHAGDPAMAIDRWVGAFPESQAGVVRAQLAHCLRAVVCQRLVAARDGSRVPVIELLLVNPAVASLIRDGRGHQLGNAIQTGRDEGMIPLERSLMELCRAGHLSMADARRLARVPEALG